MLNYERDIVPQLREFPSRQGACLFMASCLSRSQLAVETYWSAKRRNEDNPFSALLQYLWTVAQDGALPSHASLAEIYALMYATYPTGDDPLPDDQLFCGYYYNAAISAVVFLQNEDYTLIPGVSSELVNILDTYVDWAISSDASRAQQKAIDTHPTFQRELCCQFRDLRLARETKKDQWDSVVKQVATAAIQARHSFLALGSEYSEK